MKNKFRITVAGVTLSITTTEQEAYIKELADALSKEIGAVLDAASNVTLTNAALVCALDILDRCKKADASAANMRSRVREYVADASAAKIELADAVTKYNDLHSEFEQYKKNSDTEQLIARIDSLTDEIGKREREINALTSKNSAVESAVSELTYREKQASAALLSEKEKTERLEQELEDERTRAAADRAAAAESSALYDGLKLMNDELVDRAAALAERNEYLMGQLELLERMIDEERGDIIEDSMPPQEPVPEDVSVDPAMFTRNTAQLDIAPLFDGRGSYEQGEEPPTQREVDDLLSSLDEMERDAPRMTRDGEMPDLDWTKDL